MFFKRKKSSAIDRRLDGLSQEISRIEREMRGLTRGRFSREKRPAPPSPPPSTAAPPAPADLFEHAARRPPTGDAPPPAMAAGREKFANYFTAGHLRELRPSRQEMRIVRNKALLMIALVLLALIWLFYFLGTH